MTTPLEQFQRDSKDCVPIFQLWRKVWQWIFDENSCSVNHEVNIYCELVRWARIIDYQKKIRTEAFGPEGWGSQDVGKNGNPFDEISYQIEMMDQFLQKNRVGGYDETIKSLNRCNIKWQKQDLCKYWFPEFYDPQDKIKADAALKDHMDKFPEQYPKMVNNRIEGIKD